MLIETFVSVWERSPREGTDLLLCRTLYRKAHRKKVRS